MQVLGLGMKASSVDIQNAFKRLALKWHPDKCADVVEATRKVFPSCAKTATSTHCFCWATDFLPSS